MPNWSDDEGRYWWKPEGRPEIESVEIPHPPVSIEKGCTCLFCKAMRLKKRSKSDA